MHSNAPRYQSAQVVSEISTDSNYGRVGHLFSNAYISPTQVRNRKGLDADILESSTDVYESLLPNHTRRESCFGPSRGRMNGINMKPNSLHSHFSSVLAMAKIVQALTLLSLISRAFAVTAYLYDVIQCPSNNYISTMCSNLPQLSCCTDYYGVRSIRFLHFIYI